MKKSLILFFTLVPNFVFGWGFFVHRHINRYAIFTLPPPLFQFYKYYLGYITEHAVDPDKRRSFDFSEKEKHFIDLDFYTENGNCNYEDVLKNFLQDDKRQHGNSPFNVIKVKYDLTNAFKNLDIYKILKLSTDIGHYIGDINVPLHTTSNYDGQKDGQEGVHILWETRVPELFEKNYKYFVSKASYVNDPIKVVWETVLETHRKIEMLLKAEKEVANEVKVGTHVFENKNTYSKKVVSKIYAYEFNKKLKGQIEDQILRSIKMLGDFWFTCWQDAGSPDLSGFIGKKNMLIVDEDDFVEVDDSEMDGVQKENYIEIEEDNCY